MNIIGLCGTLSLSRKHWHSDQIKQGMQGFIEWINRELIFCDEIFKLNVSFFLW